MTDRLISVITPFYNSMRFIETPLNSVLNQTYQNWEYICVDDCSTDGTLEKLREYAAKDPRIKVFAREKNSGSAAGGFNVGIDVAKGDYFQILGHDDNLSPDLLENIAKRIDETGADVVIPDVRIVGKELSDDAEDFDFIGVLPLNKGKKDKYKPADRSVVLSGREAFALSINWRIHGWACFSAALVKKCGKLYEDVMNPDELWSRTLFLNAGKVVFCEGRYVYLRRKGSICTKINAKSFDLFLTLQRLKDLLTENRSGGTEMKIWKKEVLSKVRMLSYRYIFCKHLLPPEEDAKAKEFLRYGWKMAFRECWRDIRFYLTIFRIKSTERRYKKYLSLKKSLLKKGLLG